MKINNKIIILAMLVMMIACVSAVSATDIESSDNVTDVIEVDEVTDVVEEDVIDDVSEDVVEEDVDGVCDDSDECDCCIVGANSVIVNDTNYVNYFDSTTGWTTSNNNLTFVGSFTPKTFGNFKIGSSVIVNACNATFTNVGFDLKVSHITLCGGTFIGDATTNLTSVISAEADHAIIKCVTMNLTAPENKDCYAINLANAEKSKILNNEIYYTDLYKNQLNYNYVIKVIDSANVLIDGNKINANVPIKRVNYTRSGINADMVAAVAVYNCNYLNFTNNNLTTEITNISDEYPTLSEVLILDSGNVKVAGNKIVMKDEKTGKDETNYLYGIDVYRCNSITIDNNTININSEGGQIIINGTGAAYGIQLTGPHNGVVISNNIINTANNGPNLGIYSQNYFGATDIVIFGNTINVTGSAGGHPYALVSGMELQDTNATVYNNTIRVNNTSPYTVGNYAFGISYCQATDDSHYFNIHDNNVELINGDMAVSLRTGSSGFVTFNKLKTHYGTGDNVVSAPRTEVIVLGNT